MPIGRSQMRKQVEGQLRGARGEKRKVNKASKLHKKQSKIIKKHIKDMRRGRS